MRCPHCKKPLKTAERLGVEIEYCLVCRGVWLDRGELDKIIERAAEFHVPHTYHNEDFPQFDTSKKQNPVLRYPESTKKTYLEDLFDFDD